MNKQTYLCKVVSTGEVFERPFEPAHYREVGIAPRTLGGMPVLEAYQLVNRWNIVQASQRFVYALG